MFNFSAVVSHSMGKEMVEIQSYDLIDIVHEFDSLLSYVRKKGLPDGINSSGSPWHHISLDLYTHARVVSFLGRCEFIDSLDLHSQHILDVRL